MTKKAFTLIELLVVIAIIGLLAGAVSVAFSESRKSSRDSRRISDMKALQTAIEMYGEANNVFPDSRSCGGPSITADNYTYYCNSEGTEHDSDTRWIKNFGNGSPLKDFIAKDPFDPSHDGTPGNLNTEAGSYIYYATNWNSLANKATTYALIFRLEKGGTEFEKNNNGPVIMENGYNWAAGAGNNTNGVAVIWGGL